MFLLDTNAVSEPIKKHPNHGFMDWFNRVAQDQLVISCFVIGELQKGVELTQNAAQCERLQAFVNGVVETFSQTTYNFDTTSAKLWGNLLGAAQKLAKNHHLSIVSLPPNASRISWY